MAVPWSLNENNIYYKMSALKPFNLIYDHCIMSSFLVVRWNPQLTEWGKMRPINQKTTSSPINYRISLCVVSKVKYFLIDAINFICLNLVSCANSDAVNVSSRVAFRVRNQWLQYTACEWLRANCTSNFIRLKCESKNHHSIWNLYNTNTECHRECFGRFFFCLFTKNVHRNAMNIHAFCKMTS